MKTKFVAAFLLTLCLSGCGGSENHSTATTQQEEVTSATMTDEAYCESLISYGAADAYIDRENGILYVGFTSGAVTGEPDDVARLWLEDAIGSGVASLNECRVVELPDGKTLGRYRKH